GAGQVCLEPCVSEFSARACGKPGAYPMAWRGFEFGAGPPCEKGQVVGHIDFGNACCLPDGTCTNVINDCACYELGGTPQGWPSGCTTAACCFADGSCMELLDYSDCAACEQMGGQVHYDQTCDAVDCTTTSADPLSWGRTKSVYR
ncbi:MAG TPA: hypothetical protein VKU85_14815, partial [bacterium]|nr:hypothetical protein [bacterium]